MRSSCRTSLGFLANLNTVVLFLLPHIAVFVKPTQSARWSFRHPLLSFKLTSITAAPSWAGHHGLALRCNLGHCRLFFSSHAPPTHTHTHISCDPLTQMEASLFPSLTSWSERVRNQSWNQSAMQRPCSADNDEHQNTGQTDAPRIDLWDYCVEEEGAGFVFCNTCLQRQVTY